MKRDFLKNSFSIFFLGIFFIKMLLCATPLFLSGTDNVAVNAIIMQLEMEDSTEKSPEKIKTTLSKEYCSDISNFTFHNPIDYLAAIPVTLKAGLHVRTFYPSVPTPPPNSQAWNTILC